MIRNKWEQLLHQWLSSVVPKKFSRTKLEDPPPTTKIYIAYQVVLERMISCKVSLPGCIVNTFLRLDSSDSVLQWLFLGWRLRAVLHLWNCFKFPAYQIFQWTGKSSQSITFIWLGTGALEHQLAFLYILFWLVCWVNLIPPPTVCVLCPIPLVSLSNLPSWRRHGLYLSVG